MTAETPTIPENIESRFAIYPEIVRRKAEQVRALIYEVAAADPQVGALQETLKWGQPSYLTAQSGSGTTIRVDWREKEPDDLVLFVNCRTTLVDGYRNLFPDTFSFEGNRALVISNSQKIDRGATRDALAHCISMALRYHIDK